jgi:transposase
MIQEKSWEITDAFWDKVKDLLMKIPRDPDKTYKRREGGGRKGLDFRVVLSAIFYVLRTGIQWKALPQKEFCSASPVHKYFKFWAEQGVFLRMWQRGLNEYDEIKGIGWEWQSGDSSSVKAPLAREDVGPNPTDRGKKWDQTPYPNGRQRRTTVNCDYGSKCS